jgi:hypothetical protein
MSRRSAAALGTLATAVALALAGCAAPAKAPPPPQHQTGSASAPPDGPVTGAPGAGTPATAATGGGQAGGGAAGGSGAGGYGCTGTLLHGQVTLTEADNGRPVCVATGTTVEIYLHAQAGQQWSKPVPDKPILQPTETGKGMLQRGVSAGFYLAAQPGQTVVSAQLVPCTGPKPGPACDVVEHYQVTVTVR